MVVCDPNLFPQVETLRQIQRVTLKTAQLLNALNFPSLTPDSLQALQVEHCHATFAPLDLPLPDEILTPILKLAASESLRDAIRQCFTNRIAEMQRKYIANYQQTCAFLLQTAQPGAPNGSLRQAYLDLYRSQWHVLVETQLPYVMKEVVKLKRSALRQDATRIEFNRKYTPILESYFAYNAYPSLPDRLLLAKKSMMTPRQIEVWFQNHRNRAKKDGVTLRRISPYTASTFAFDEPVHHSPQVITLSRSRSESSDIEFSDDDVSLRHREDIVSKDQRPPHAFPTPYTIKSGSSPFSQDNQVFKFHLTSRNWMRLPATHAPRHSSMSVDDLTNLFAHMNMRGPARASCSSKSLLKQRKWASPLMVAPSAAPHPALVNPSYASPLSNSQILYSCTWQQPSLRMRKSATSRSQTSYPSWAIPGTPRRRKSPCLVRHLPSSPHNTHRFNTSSRTSSTSSTSSASSSSSSSTGSRSTSMSSSSSQRTVEPPGATPGNSMSIGNMVDYSSVNTLECEFGSSADLQAFPSFMWQNEFPDLSQGWTLQGFVTLDLPAFTFFES